MRSRLRTLLVTAILLGACGDDDRTRDGDGGAVPGPDGSLADGGTIPNVGDASMDARIVGDIDSSIVMNDGSTMQLPDGRVVGGDAGTPFVFNDAGQVLCGTAVCQCSDGIDQDLDGLFDGQDPECISPWDNDEATFATGIPGDNRDEACQDCFFDGNSGAGDDGCRIATSCLTTGMAEPGKSNGCNTCVANDKCRTSCQAYTPNGCDCFGCCTVNLGSGIIQNVLLAPGCDINGTTLSAQCQTCMPSTTCRNECGRCELCPGKTIADLPADCTSTPPGDGGTPAGDAGTQPDGSIVGATDAGTPPITPTCDNGEQVCGAGLPACPALHVCAFGCCIQTPLQ